MQRVIRKINENEMYLLKKLVSMAQEVVVSEKEYNDLRVESLDDGGMGSIRFCSIDNNLKRVFGKRVAELSFTDSDGVEVIASLNLDNNGNIFEIDIWKTDFSKLKTYSSELG